MYHLVSGHTPFAGDNAMTVMMKHVTQPPPEIRSPFPLCPPALADVILKMMQKDPPARQQSHEEVRTDLRRAFDALAGSPTPVARRPVAAGRPAAKKSGVPVGAIVGGVLALCAAVGALVHFAPWKKQGQLSEAEQAANQSSPALQRAEPPAMTGRPDGLKASTTLAAATKDAPFVNTLGMKFVPVPGTKVLFSIWETRVKDYAEYGKANKVDDSWTKQEKDGVPAGHQPDHPVCGVNWDDANAFCKWLTEKESKEGRLPVGMKYRLPTDGEWSRAVGLPPETGATPADRNRKNQVDYPWGLEFPPWNGKGGNYSDSAFHEKFPNDQWVEGYTDGYATTAPAGTFAPNEFAIYDLGGNVREWCEDLFNPAGTSRVLRGGTWSGSFRGYLVSSDRSNFASGVRERGSGFRCVLDVAPGPEKIAYQSKAGMKLDRFAWKGTRVKVLSAAKDLDTKVMAELVGTLDKVYEFFRETTDREPAKTKDYHDLRLHRRG